MRSGKKVKPSGNSVVGGIAWKLLERMASLLISLSVTMVLSRLLEPEEFGTVEIVTVFVNLSIMIMTSGLGNALIQKKETEALDYSTIFWINMLFSFALYITGE